LTATGGSGYGFFWWFSDNWLVAEINQDGRVHIRSVGEANIWLWYRGGTLFEEVVPTFVHLTITQATPRLSTVNPPVAAGLPFGKPLASSALSGDVLGVDGTPLIGTLAWEAEEAATLIPGSVGHETSVGADGKTYRARQDGVYYAPAVFTPAQDIYGGVYAPITLLVKVPIYASEDTRTTLEKEVQAAAGSIRPKLRKAEENYDASSLARFYRALEAVERALAADTSQASSQDTTEALLSELAAAEAGLRHDHSVLTNSADTGVSETGRSVTLRIKGELTTVTGILLNETHFALGVPDAQSGERALTFEGRRCGTVRAGSVIIELSSDFVDSLDNGSFAVAVDFDDGYQKGSGSVSFTVSRKAPLQNDDSPEAVAPSGPESPVFFAAPAAPAVVAVIVDDDTPLGAPLTSSSQGAAADNGEESLTLPPEALAAIEQSQALADTTAFWVFIVPLAAAVVALVVGTLLVQSRKLLRNKGEKNAQS
ncbi:MAG: hypothetical protein LBJ48_00005, partial [Coriobacteriales bacterium]|nr:hypothetical protein [Coriobacteriales bacterium]